VKQKTKIVALVPLRGGSKSIPYKNIKNIAGKPLCLWVLEAAISAEMIGKVYASTDSIKIKETINNAVPAVEVIDRDPQLATDTASTESVMLDFAGKTSFDILVTIQATSPLTKALDFDNAIKYFLENELDSLLTGVRVKKFFWTDEAKPVNHDPFKRQRRQDFKGWIMENGAFYITKKNILEKYKCRLGGRIGFYEMEQESAFEIDEPIDWEIVERFLLQRK
jgi:CMP-N-acetylneuraminic acid synthetase